MAGYTSTQSGNFNDAATWGGGGWPSAGGDTYIVSSGHTVTVNGDFSGTDLWASTVDGILAFATGASTALQHNAWIEVNNGGEIRMGNSGSPIGAAYTAQLIWNGANAGTFIIFHAGGKLTTNGTATHNIASEAWASCTTTLNGAANSGQADATITDATMAGKAVAGQQFLVQGTTSYTQCEIMTVLSVAGAVITFDGNFANTHADGAVVVPLYRNVIIRGSDASHRPKIDDNNTVTASANVDCKLTEFRAIHYFDAPLGREDFDYCVFNQPGYSAFYNGYDSPLNMTNSIIAGAVNRAIRNHYGIKLTDCLIGKVSNYALFGCANFTLDNVVLFGGTTAFESGGGTAKDCTVKNFNTLFLGLDGDVDLTSCSVTATNYITSTQLNPARVDARNCVISPSAHTLLDDTCRAVIREQDAGQTLGAAKTTFINIGTIERQNSVARSGYAAECTPDTECSSDEPLPIKWDIACVHGDVITVTVYVRVNATYGTVNDPSFILDPDSIYGCNDTASENISAADTWTQLSVTGTANLGGAGKKGVVNCVLRIPYYTSGGKVYVDDFEVTIA